MFEEVGYRNKDSGSYSPYSVSYTVVVYTYHFYYLEANNSSCIGKTLAIIFPIPIHQTG
jgi:hypothetical protein